MKINKLISLQGPDSHQVNHKVYSESLINIQLSTLFPCDNKASNKIIQLKIRFQKVIQYK